MQVSRFSFGSSGINAEYGISGMQRMFSSRAVNRCSYRRFCSSRVDIFHPTETHRQIRETVKAFTQNEVVHQAREHDNKEMFNRPLFNKLGDLGLLGITVSFQISIFTP
eukprot:TRINITY_DN1343_c0_g1_i5.p1 TRINITY_DN1343_c0_g1~~TRINITY_DN1343_c0_g1_i5.p1  ORF type:complete len:109 (-),score=19.35 TRINITY_DN1343_c0_g1_i5:118-444(-)